MPTNRGSRKIIAGKAGHRPGLFFARELLYKAHDRPSRQLVL